MIREQISISGMAVSKPETSIQPESTDEKTEGAITIVNGNAHIRKGPGTIYEKSGKIARLGETFFAAITDGWLPIRKSDNEVLWISKNYVDNTGKCTGSTVNIRLGPGKNFKSVGYAQKGDMLSIVIPGNWVPVVIDGAVYWISGTFAKYKQN